MIIMTFAIQEKGERPVVRCLEPIEISATESESFARDKISEMVTAFMLLSGCVESTRLGIYQKMNYAESGELGFAGLVDSCHTALLQIVDSGYQAAIKSKMFMPSKPMEDLLEKLHPMLRQAVDEIHSNEAKSASRSPADQPEGAFVKAVLDRLLGEILKDKDIARHGNVSATLKELFEKHTKDG